MHFTEKRVAEYFVDVEKLLPYLASAGCINVIKTSMRPGYKGLKISKTVSSKQSNTKIFK